jgi:hypothetical protein
MRKWVLRIGTFLLSLILGIGASAAWTRHRLISLCDIDATPEKYAGKTVRLRAFVFNEVVTGGPVPHGPEIVACSVCVGAEAWPAARADLEPQQIGLVPEHNQLWIREHVWQEGKTYVTEAVLVGRFEPPALGITHYFAPQYHLADARIERVIATHEFENTEQAAQWLKSKSE